jgi:hypothetical protein
MDTGYTGTGMPTGAIGTHADEQVSLPSACPQGPQRIRLSKGA